MAKTLNLIKVSTVLIKDPENGQYGESRSVLCIHEDYVGKSKQETPKEACYWLRFKPHEYDQIPEKGADLTLIPNPNGKGYSIVGEYQTIQLTPPTPTTAAPTQPKEIDKRAIAQDATTFAKLYAFCFSQATAAMPDGVGEETIRCAASSVFIAVKDKYDLSKKIDQIFR